MEELKIRVMLTSTVKVTDEIQTFILRGEFLVKPISKKEKCLSDYMHELGSN